MEREREIWFPAKRYGWGWGPPVKWQGWGVLAAFTAVILFAGFRFAYDEPWLFVLVIVASNAALLLVCWWKGERPRWRWGDKDAAKR